jgi:WD40 repeat protein
MNPYYFSFSHALSPSGDIIAALLMNFKAYDYDIVLFSADDGRIIKNITRGYTLKYEFIKYEIDPSRGKDITWSPDGDRIAFFARADEKYSLFVINALTGKTIKNIKINEDQPASPCFFPGGKEIVYTAFKKGRPDLFKVDLETENVRNLTEDEFFEKAPSISPDGEKIAYTVRVDSFDKIFISPINNLKKKTQITFGRSDTITPEFSADSNKIYFSGDMREAFNIYSIDLQTGELVRYTDVRTGNFFPIPVNNDSNKIIFSAFNKGAFQVFKSEFEGEVEKTVTFTEVEPEEEFRRFEPILTFEIDKNKVKPHKGMGKLYLDARPPIGAIVSTDGSIYGGSAISFSDIMGDYNFFLMAYQVQSYRSYYFAYTNMKKRLHYMVNAYDYTLFYYSYYSSYAYPDPLYYDRYTYRDAIATRKYSGVDFSLYYPFNRYYRVQASLGYSHYEEEYYDPAYAGVQISNYFWNGDRVAATFALTGETTRFKNYGPATGNTFQLLLTQAIPVSKNFLQNTTIQLDYRHYLYLGSDFLFAFRLKGFASRGRNPYLFYYGGNNEVRSAYYYSIVGTEGWYANLEFRVPLVSAANTILGQLGPIRGTIFIDVTRAKLGDFPAQFSRVENGRYVFADAIGSFGYGFQFFLFGLPFHIEFAKMLEIPDFSNPFKYNTVGEFRTKFWIGFDF